MPNLPTVATGHIDREISSKWMYFVAHTIKTIATASGIQDSRNTGMPMIYGEAYQTLFPRMATVLG